MKFLFAAIILTSFLPYSFAETLKTRIYSIEQSEESHLPHLVLLENGRVATVDSSEKSSLTELEKIRAKKYFIQLEVDRDNKLMSFALAPASKESFYPDPEPVPQPNPSQYNPTNLASMEEASAIFGRMDRRTQRNSQCYNRAHIWAYEEWQTSALNSVKLFMFFTKRYIWDYNYKWWFHVTPLTYVAGVPMTLDRTFMKKPTDVKTWTLNFIHSRRDCPVVQKYSQYSNNQETEHCYLIPAPMYFWQPRDLDNFERTGAEKKSYVKQEINHAYWEAF